MNILACTVTGARKPSGSYSRDACCRTSHLLISEVLIGRISFEAGVITSVEMFHLNPKILTLVSLSATSSAIASAWSSVLLEAQDLRLNLACSMIDLAFV